MIEWLNSCVSPEKSPSGFHLIWQPLKQIPLTQSHSIRKLLQTELTISNSL